MIPTPECVDSGVHSRTIEPPKFSRLILFLKKNRIICDVYRMKLPEAIGKEHIIGSGGGKKKNLGIELFIKIDDIQQLVNEAKLT
jgi:hypothetical protein